MAAYTTTMTEVRTCPIASKKELSFEVKFHHRRKGIISGSIMRQKKENNVGKVMYTNSCQFVTLL